VRRLSTLLWQIAIGLAALAIWQWGWQLHDRLPWLVPDLLDPYFVSRPSDIFSQFLRMGCLVSSDGQWTFGEAGAFTRCIGKSDNNLWIATYVTLKNTLWGFAIGVSSGFALGLLLGRSDRLSEIFYPYITAFNSIPRIALAPIIILAFGIGDASKIVTAWLVVVFLVFFNTFEGARSVDRDHINAARLLGAGEWQVTRTVIVPSTMAWLFASLTPAVSFSLIGVIVGEFIGAEHGIGRMIIESEARGEAAGMMVAVFVLMIVGVILASIVRRVQAYLLRWRPAQTVGAT
jgi:NitT/TauT family transport system permease protein